MIAKIEPDENGELYLVFPEGAIDGLGWQTGDKIMWIDNNDGSWTLRKQENKKEYVVIDAIQSFRVRYVVERDLTNDNIEDVMDSLDNIDTSVLKEFSQKYIGENISSVRVIDTVDEVISLCDIDNDYTKSWNTDHKIKTFINTENDYDAEAL
jgi:hypothetical protein